MSDANNITNRLLIEIPKRFPNCRVWRRNVGAGLGYSQIRAATACLTRGDIAGALVILRTRLVRWGLEGEPDLDGIISVVSPEGRKYGVRIGIEVKAGKDRTSEIQDSFLTMLNKFGGIGFVAHSVDQGLETLEAAVRGMGV